MIMRQPTGHERDQMRAVLGGYCEQIDAIRLDDARARLRTLVADDVLVDRMMVARMLGRLGFRRSYRPQDAGAIVYRRDPQ